MTSESTSIISTTTDTSADDVADSEYLIKRCTKRHSCGHRCNGTRDETECNLPCLDPACLPSNSNLPNSDELCTICYTQELGAQSCIKIGCGHVFHADCLLNLLKHRWNTLRITFAFLQCPNCKQEITVDSECGPIAHELAKLRQL